MRLPIAIAVLAIVLLTDSVHAQMTVYDTVSPNASFVYSELNAFNPIFGDALHLSQGGLLQQIGFDVYNPSSGGNTGTILTGLMTVKLYDNTNPYTSGSLNAHDPIISTFNASIDFTGIGGLAPGFFYRTLSPDLTADNVTLPQNIFITQQFTELTGTSTANGTIFSANNSAEGSSPADVYISSAATSEGTYTGGTGNLNQFAFEIAISVPEPATLGLCAVSMAAICYRRRRN